MSQPRTIPLAAITGRSRYNVRPEGDAAGFDAMAASIAARGQLQNLIVRVSADHPDLYEIDDGGCRWDAMRRLVDRGVWTWQHPVDVLVVNGEAGAARERSLAANIVRRNLHPVEEFEAFAALAADGFSVETIAADFGVSARFVRQRLTYDRLSPRVRAAWRAGHLSAEATQALTIGDHAAQDALLDESPPEQKPHAWQGYNLKEIKRRMSPGAVKADALEAIYVGIEAYVAAGGAVDDNLFEEHALLLDAPLLKRLARAKMIDEGTPLLDRYGYGFCVIREEIEKSFEWKRLPFQLTAEDHAALAALDAREEAALGDLDDADPDYDAKGYRIQDEIQQARDAIEQRAITRASTAAERQAAGIFLSIDFKGELLVDLGRVPPAADRSERVTREGSVTPPPESPRKSKPAEDAPKPAGPTLMAVMDDALTRAWAAIIGDRPYLAILLATAALNTYGSQSAIRIRAEVSTDTPGRCADFVEALAKTVVGARDNFDIIVNFAQAVASTVVVAPKSTYQGYRHGDAEHAALAALLAHNAGDDYAKALTAALDYEAYFAAAAKDGALRAIEEAGGDAKSAKKLSKGDLVSAAALLCRDKAWLPPELRLKDGKTGYAEDLDRLFPPPAPAPAPAPSLADAMAEALAADDAEAEEPPTASDMLGDFLRAHCRRDDDREMAKAADVFEVFRQNAPADAVALLPTMRAFGKAMADFGFRKKRLSSGVHYLGLAFASSIPIERAAE